MKGFVYLIEIAIAAIIMTLVLSVFFSIRIKQDWQGADIISSGNNILSMIGGNSLLQILNQNFTVIESNKPQNVKYSLTVIGSPKSNISVGCVLECGYLNGLLSTGSFVNGRWINFSVSTFDINTGIPTYDVIVLINYTNYSNAVIKSYLSAYQSGGGAVIGINATLSNSDAGFNNFFNLTSGSGSLSTVNFTSYNPSDDDIGKYFLGTGMTVTSDWYIWEHRWNVAYWGGNKINLTDSSNPSLKVENLVEGSVFGMTGPDAKTYSFRVKKIWYPLMVVMQPLNKSFVFNDFSEGNVNGKNIVGTSSHAALATNNSAVWMSNFPQSDDYASLLKAAILSRTDVWTSGAVATGKEKTTVSSFKSLCCDMPETTELYLTLWYGI